MTSGKSVQSKTHISDARFDMRRSRVAKTFEKFWNFCNSFMKASLPEEESNASLARIGDMVLPWRDDGPCLDRFDADASGDKSGFDKAEVLEYKRCCMI